MPGATTGPVADVASEVTVGHRGTHAWGQSHRIAACADAPEERWTEHLILARCKQQAVFWEPKELRQSSGRDIVMLFTSALASLPAD